MEGKGVHVLVYPFPIQGHINPMLQFSKRIAAKGLRVTLLASHANLPSMQPHASSVHFLPIHDGLQKNDNSSGDSDSDEPFLQHYKRKASQSLAEIIHQTHQQNVPVKFIIYDAFIPWVLDVARQNEIDGAPFLTQSCAVDAIYFHVHQKSLTTPLQAPTFALPSLPMLEVDDLPSFVSDSSSYPDVLDLVVNQFSNSEQVEWIFCNTFDMLEEEIVKWMANQRPIKAIGPTIPSIYADGRLLDDRDYGLSLFKPNVDACIEWLNSRETASVVYVSFGSLAALGEEQMGELAMALRKSECFFLWVVRESETAKLPQGFVEETAEKGLVVNWCRQLEVLAHEAVGCFVTHCGWNSTLEALSMGVPMVAIPQWTDQPTNAKFLADVWKVGVRVKKDERGFVTKDEIETCIREVMGGEKGNEIRRSSIKWRALAKEAVDEGGSSDTNINEFVTYLTQIR